MLNFRLRGMWTLVNQIHRSRSQKNVRTTEKNKMSQEHFTKEFLSNAAQNYVSMRSVPVHKCSGKPTFTDPKFNASEKIVERPLSTTRTKNCPIVNKNNPQHVCLNDPAKCLDSTLA